MRDWGQSQALTHFPSKEWAITFYFKDTVAFAPCQSPCRIYFNMAKFQKVFAGRTECSRGPHAARGP